MKKNKRNNKKNLIIFLYFIAYLFVRLWAADKENLTSTTLSVIVIPYVDINIGTITILITGIAVIALLIVGKFRFDNMLPLFILQVGLYFIPTIYVDGDFRWGTAYAIIQMAIVYYIGYNYTGDFKWIVYTLIGASLILAFQIFLTLLINGVSLFSDSLKWYMRLPSGNSNSLGTFIVAIYVLADNYFKSIKINKFKSILKYIYYAIMWVCLYATGTRSGLLVLVGYYIYLLFEFLIKRRKLNKKNSKYIFAILIIAFICVCVFGEELLDKLDTFTVGSLTSSRILVYSDVFGYIVQNPLLGRSAYSYQAYDAVMAHNWLLESLVQTGIVGTAIFLTILFITIYRISKIKDKKLKRIFIAFIAIVLVHGSVEPNLFTTSSNTFFWFILGIGTAISARDKTRIRIVFTNKSKNKMALMEHLL